MDSPTVRVGMPLLALYIFYWGIYQAPPVEDDESDNGAMTLEASRQLLAETRALLEKSKYAEALAPTRQLHAAFPQNHIYIEQLAVIHNHLGNWKDEAAAWELYMVHSPTPVDGCPQIGQAYLKLNQPKDAMRAFERCYSFDEADCDSIFFLGYVNERFGDSAKAMALYAKGMKLQPRYWDLPLGYARMLLRGSKPKEALAIAHYVLRYRPDNVDALLVAGIASERMGSNAEARQYLLRGAQLSPGYADFTVALEKLNPPRRKGRS